MTEGEWHLALPKGLGPPIMSMKLDMDNFFVEWALWVRSDTATLLNISRSAA